MRSLSKPIEKIFLESILRFSLVSILLVIIIDVIFVGFNPRSLIVNTAVLFAIGVSYFSYTRGHFHAAVLLIGFIIMGAMFYQSIVADAITTSSMAVIMIVGFGFSVILTGSLPWLLHAITLTGMILVFTWLAMHPLRYGQPNASNIIVAGFTYVVLYSLIAYTSKILKQRYDDTLIALAVQNKELEAKSKEIEIQNLELIEKSNEIETQNEELTQGQENLYQLNLHLENKVQERTLKIQHQNDKLISYAYSNAHHVRGPVARVLGLIQLSRMDPNIGYQFLFEKIEEQAREIDEVIKQINNDLEKGDEEKGL